MKWTRGDRSNVEDVRGRSGMRMGGIGLGGLLVVLLLMMLLYIPLQRRASRWSR